MKTTLDPKTGILTITIHGDLISTSADQIRAQMNEVLDAPAGPDTAWRLLRLELLTAKMVDSVGLNFIVSILKAVQKNGAKMQLVYTNPNVHRTFLFTRLDKHVELLKV
jgi:anti-anti-sigma factor